MIDCHTHTYYSHDSKQDPKETIPYAIEKGIDYLAFTDHCDKDCLFNEEYVKTIRQIDLDSCFLELNNLKDQYKTKLEIAVGLECGFMNQATPMYEEILKKYPQTRSNDKELVLMLFRDYYGIGWGVPFAYVMRSKRLPSFESVRRARQRIQEYYPDFRAEEPVESIRIAEQEDYISYSREEPAI